MLPVLSVDQSFPAKMVPLGCCEEAIKKQQKAGRDGRVCGVLLNRLPMWPSPDRSIRADQRIPVGLCNRTTGGWWLAIPGSTNSFYRQCPALANTYADTVGGDIYSFYWLQDTLQLGFTASVWPSRVQGADGVTQLGKVDKRPELGDTNGAMVATKTAKIIDPDGLDRFINNFILVPFGWSSLHHV